MFIKQIKLNSIFVYLIILFKNSYSLSFNLKSPHGDLNTSKFHLNRFYELANADKNIDNPFFKLFLIIMNIVEIT